VESSVKAQSTIRARSSERGEGKFKAVAITAIFVFLIYVAFKVVPPYVSEYQLADKMQETARFASVNRSGPDSIRDTIFREVQDLDIANVQKDDIKVTSDSGKVTISLDYTVPIDIIVYKFDLHFTPTSMNKALI
jgi:predicted membrane protein